MSRAECPRIVPVTAHRDGCLNGASRRLGVCGRLTSQTLIYRTPVSRIRRLAWMALLTKCAAPCSDPLRGRSYEGTSGSLELPPATVDAPSTSELLSDDDCRLRGRTAASADSQ